MREIKFRAWSKEDKKMEFYDYWFTVSHHGYLCFQHGPDPIYVDDSDVDYPDRVIVMQYTGLKDKNGKEIYEGDIIFEEYNVMSFGTDLGERKETLIVKIPDFYYWLANAAGDVGDDYIGEYVSEMVVSGNIYENPNLLSQDK